MLPEELRILEAQTSLDCAADRWLCGRPYMVELEAMKLLLQKQLNLIGMRANEWREVYKCKHCTQPGTMV